MDNHYEIITKNAEATSALGQKVARDLNREAGPHILALYGDLGSGKTTFTQGFAKALGVSHRLLSPTFIIVRRYDIPAVEKMLYHIDLYRLKNASEMEELGLSEIFADPAAYAVVEWAEKLEEDLPVPRTDIIFKVLSDGSHKISVTKVIT